MKTCNVGRTVAEPRTAFCGPFWSKTCFVARADSPVRCTSCPFLFSSMCLWCELNGPLNRIRPKKNSLKIAEAKRLLENRPFLESARLKNNRKTSEAKRIFAKSFLKRHPKETPEAKRILQKWVPCPQSATGGSFVGPSFPSFFATFAPPVKFLGSV